MSLVSGTYMVEEIHRMIILLFVELSVLIVCLGLYLATARRLRHREETPIYVYPVPGLQVGEQLEECNNLAASIQTFRSYDTTRFATMWESGLGKEFPPMGRN